MAYRVSCPAGQDVSRNAGCWLACALVLALAGCAPGTTRPPATPSAPAAPVKSGLDSFAEARAEELAQATRAAQDIEAATQNLPPAQRVRVRGVETGMAEVMDHQTQEKRNVPVLDRLVVDVPVSLRGLPEHDAVMAPVKKLATYLAGKRGTAMIDRAFAPADAHAEKIQPQQSTARTPDGHEITVTLAVDPDQWRGFEHVVVRGAQPAALP